MAKYLDEDTIREVFRQLNWEEIPINPEINSEGLEKSLDGVVENCKASVEEAKEALNIGEIPIQEEIQESMPDVSENITLPEIDYDIELGEGMDKPIETPGIDNSATAQGINDTVAMFHNMVTDIGNEMARLDGAGFNFTGGFGNMMTTGKFTVTPVGHAINGGMFRSGDVFTANENGTPEMIGRFGNQTAVANNTQIVGGISRGVAQANEGVESRLGTIETLLTRILNKEFVAKAVPSSGWGEHGTRSSEQYSRVTGVY
jgi:hypothetical protein